MARRSFLVHDSLRIPMLSSGTGAPLPRNPPLRFAGAAGFQGLMLGRSAGVFEAVPNVGRVPLASANELISRIKREAETERQRRVVKEVCSPLSTSGTRSKATRSLPARATPPSAFEEELTRARRGHSKDELLRLAEQARDQVQLSRCCFSFHGDMRFVLGSRACSLGPEIVLGLEH
jgi:hypothetical protein